MQFHIDADNGTSIAGWLAPDNPAVIPRLAISSPDHHKEVELEANVLRADLKELGLHGTGMAGFVIDDRVLPGLETLEDVEIRDAATRLLIYRRHRDSLHQPRKLFFYSLHAMPQTRLEERASQHFAQGYVAVERHSFDTLFSVINNQFAKSIFVSGRPRLLRYDQLLRDRDFLIVTLLRDPYEELAERLLFVRYASADNSPAFATQYMAGLEPLVDLVKTIDFGDKASIAGAFKSLTDSQREALSNPYVRGLACSLDDIPNRKHVSIALDKLAEMDLVGLASRFEEFKSMLGEIVGVDMLGDTELSQVSWVPKTAAHLKQIDAVKYLLALDIELFSQAHAAVSKVLNAA